MFEQIFHYPENEWSFYFDQYYIISFFLNFNFNGFLFFKKLTVKKWFSNLRGCEKRWTNIWHKRDSIAIINHAANHKYSTFRLLIRAESCGIMTVTVGWGSQSSCCKSTTVSAHSTHCRWFAYAYVSLYVHVGCIPFQPTPWVVYLLASHASSFFSTFAGKTQKKSWKKQIENSFLKNNSHKIFTFMIPCNSLPIISVTL